MVTTPMRLASSASLIVELGDLGDHHAGGGAGPKQGDQHDLPGAGQQGVQPQQQKDGPSSAGDRGPGGSASPPPPGDPPQIQAGDGGEGDADGQHTGGAQGVPQVSTACPLRR